MLATLERATPDLRQRWPRRALALSWVAGLAITALAFGWPRSGPDSAPARTSAPVSTAAAGPLHLQSTRLRIDAPAYTGQATRTQNALDAKVAADSRLSWSLRFDRAPDKAWLQFHDGRRLPLSEQDGQWLAQDVARVPVLYRVVSEPALAQTHLHRLDVVADRAPSVRVLEPAATLVLGTPGQRQWSLRFEASDDYAVATQATLSITITQGSGENITFVRRSVGLTGSGEATARRFAHSLDLAALGAQPGSDVIAQLEVRDNHAPTPQAGRSSSVILRLPSAEVALGAELEGRIKKTLPAYFRSQRQIIIDAEALIRQRRSLAAEDFVKRSDAIGVDQRILRLRYGQFLGEESEGAPKPPPTSDLPTSDAPAAGSHDDEHEHDHGTEAGAHDEHGHDHGGKASNADSPPVFGSATDVLSEYGHTHDHAEAATLLDPQTRATLKAALDQMWSAEGELRQGRPEQALPFAYKALGFIKQVQQAERIYLARVGPELPPIDEGRRLGGDRAGLASRELPLAARTRPTGPSLKPGSASVMTPACPTSMHSLPGSSAMPPTCPMRWIWLPPSSSCASSPVAATAASACALSCGGRCSVHCRRRCGAVPPMRWASATWTRWRRSHEPSGLNLWIVLALAVIVAIASVRQSRNNTTHRGRRWG